MVSCLTESGGAATLTSFKIFLFILKVSVTVRGGETGDGGRGGSPSTGSLLSWQLRPGAEGFLGVSHVGIRVPDT